MSPTLPFPLSDRDAPTAGDTKTMPGRITRLARMRRDRCRQRGRDVRTLIVASLSPSYDVSRAWEEYLAQPLMSEALLVLNGRLKGLVQASQDHRR